MISENTGNSEWQTNQGLRKARSTNFTRHFGVQKHESVADLGAGGGHILGTISAREKYAVELNPHARSKMLEIYPEIRAVRFVEDLPNESIDVFYTTSVLEHVECPIVELREAFK